VKGSKSAVLATIAAGLLWGSSFAVVKIGLRSIDPFWFVFLRFAAASVLVILVSAMTGRIRQVLALLKNPLVVWLGVSNAAGFLFQFKGQTMTTAANAALLINASTLFVAMASKVVFRERFGPLKVLAVLVGMAGVFLVTTGGRPSAALGAALHGDLLVLTAALLWVELWTVPYTAVFCTVAPFLLWTWGLKRITATTSSIVLLTEIVFALALAAVLLGERLSPAALVGSALILAAVALASRERGDDALVGPDVVPEETGVQPVEEQ